MTDADPIASPAYAHVRELIAAGKHGYRVFDVLDAAGLPPDAVGSIRRALVQVVEVDLVQELKQGEGILDTARALLAMEAADRPGLFAAWARVLVAAQHNRKAMKELCSDFTALVACLSPAALLATEDFVAALIEHQKRDGLDMILEGLGATIQSMSESQREEWFAFLEPYVPLVYPKPLAGLARISGALVCHGENALLEVLGGICDLDTVENDREVEPFLLRCSGSLAQVADELGLPYLRLCLQIAKQSCGSAGSVAKQMPKRLDLLPEPARLRYLEAFARVVEHASIRTVSFCLKALHGMFAQESVSGLDEFVDAVCEVGRDYGASAADAFVQRKTAASRAAWPARD